ncbi:hypothetical protein FJT64_007345 [Amphibalanus amphitrite]|uniref:Uncharacterized protein n=1 Tax=Amphibalanus amphitrite TaxID=1232801 RepID=A0A6A4UVY0_AMPAM|nr:hypothetical protein FJT64_013733 [Amphibalanus amphitrite]KAF0295096.1 hypothetical protein FJT64_007345 [Amphibalanus amphitrite]
MLFSQCAPRCCGCVPLRRGVLAIGAVLLLAHVGFVAAAAALYTLLGDRIRADLLPRLYVVHLLNYTSAEQHAAAVDTTNRYIFILERGLLVVVGLSALGAAASALLLHAARRRVSRLLLPWILLHGCLFLLGTVVVLGGLVFGIIEGNQHWIRYSLASVPAAVLVWYWFVMVFVFYMQIRPSPGRHDPYKMAPLPTSETV